MTAQRSDKLVNLHPTIDFDKFRLFGVLIGNPLEFETCSEYTFTRKGDEKKFVICSACWRGYISVFELSNSGQLKVIGFEYPFNSGASPDNVEEDLLGDFWLDLRETFFGKKLYVPFKNGVIVEDKTTWVEHE